MRVFSVQIDVSGSRVLRAAGYDCPVRADANSRLLAFTRRDIGERTYFVARRWYSCASVESLDAWLSRFNPEQIGPWAREQDGEFQIVVVDRASRAVHLVSDRNGAWRAYYKNEDGVVSIANRRADMVGLLTRPALCPFAVYQLLTIGYVIDPYSLLDGVRTTQPGQIATFTGPSTALTTYYSPVNLAADYYPTERASLDGLDRSARRVFAKRISAGRTPLVLLSGGIDSMTMLAYLCEVAPGRVHSLTFAHVGMERDERAPARLAAKHCGSKHTEFIQDPAEGAKRFAQSLCETDTWNYPPFTYLAVRDFLESHDDAYDVFTGEDTRLHTPSFDTPKELAVRLGRGGAWRMARPFAAAASAAFAHAPFSGSLKNYCDYWSGKLRWRSDFRTCFVEALLGFDRPSRNERADNGHYARLLAEVPDVNASDGMQEVYKKYVTFEYRTQYTDDMNTMTSCFSDGRLALHCPFYDWDFVEACNRVPYALGARRVFTLKSHSKLPVVQKYVLRKLVRQKLPDEVLYRYKATNPTLHCFFNRSVRPVVDRLLERWLPELLQRLDGELAAIIAATVAEYRGREVFVRNLDEPMLVRTLMICYVAMLQHLCTHRGADLPDELAAAAEPVPAALAGRRNTLSHVQ
ncbi:MAG TPA: asparagine synthase C-terminal domain-containing protein [Gemmataceae bacterium]|jgi:asparagine synthetase B (glutamine-hydrolysing)|nr:asparagine synthase C-terminal domain-containing protein [Gemmataceae bacterium]